MFVREQRRLPPCVQEQDSIIFFKKPLADQINHPRSGTARVDWIQQETFVLRKCGYPNVLPSNYWPAATSSRSL